MRRRNAPQSERRGIRKKLVKRKKRIITKMGDLIAKSELTRAEIVCHHQLSMNLVTVNSELDKLVLVDTPATKSKASASSSTISNRVVSNMDEELQAVENDMKVVYTLYYSKTYFLIII